MFGLVTRRVGNIFVIDLEGEVDVYTAPQLRQTIMEQATTDPCQVVNLTKVDYLDSTALGVLIGGLSCLRQVAGNLVLVCSSTDRVHRALKNTGTDKFFDIYDSVEDAVSAINAEPLPAA
ncbi:MAG: anti-sigma factor antagonist [Patescibacteria group bacterium]|nr:anti-sigma factor antagonist [Patescibacteria group bacterium]